MQTTLCTATVNGISKPTDIDCAKQGLRELLEQLQPCSTALTTCGSVVPGTHDVASPLDRVGLMAFPPEKSALDYSTITSETDCYSDVGDSDITLSPSATTVSGTTGQATPDYQIVPLSSDYKTSDATGTDESVLNKFSDLVGSAYWGRCPGGVAPTGNAAGSSIVPAGSTVATNTAGIGGGAGTAANIGSADNGIAGGANTGDTSNDVYTNKTTTTASSLSLSTPNNATIGDYLVATITGEAAGSARRRTSAPRPAAAGRRSSRHFRTAAAERR